MEIRARRFQHAHVKCACITQITLRTLCTTSLLVTVAGRLAMTETPEGPRPSSARSKSASTGSEDPLPTGSSSPNLANLLGISFPSDSQSTAVLAIDGRRYLIDVATKTVIEIHAQSSGSSPGSQSDKDRQIAAMLFSKNCAGCHGPDGKGNRSIGTPNFTDPAFQKSVSASAAT